MFPFDYIDPLVFFIALGVGIFIAYVMNPTPKIVHKYPTVENAGKITYLDDEGVCYKYNYEEVSENDIQNKSEVLPLQN